MKDLITIELNREHACHLLEQLTSEYDGDPCFTDAPSLSWHITNMQTMLALSNALGLDHWFDLSADQMMQKIERLELR
jgi:hypothetical protein